MFGILALILVMAYSAKAAAAVWSESEIYREFGEGCYLPMAFLAILPLGPLALIALPPFVGWVPAAIVAVVCFAPALLTFRRYADRFDRSGTTRTGDALKSAHMGVSVAMAGLLYVGAFVAFSLAVATL